MSNDPTMFFFKLWKQSSSRYFPRSPLDLNTTCLFSINTFLSLLLWSLQISLATRDKIQTPPIYYPPVHTHRPASASLSYHRNRLASRNGSNLCHNRRPLSADSRFINTKGNSSVKFNFGNVSLGFFPSSVVVVVVCSHRVELLCYFPPLIFFDFIL